MGSDLAPPTTPATSVGTGRPAAESSESLPLGRYLAAILRYKWLILAIAALGTAGGIGAVRFLMPSYLASATIWVSSQRPDGREAGPIRAEGLLNATSWPELLKSYAILDNVARRQRLYLQPADPADSLAFRDFELGERLRPGQYELRIEGGRYRLLAGAVQFESGLVGDSIGRAIGVRWAPAPAAIGDGVIRFAVVPPRDAAVELRQRLSAVLPRDGNLLRVEMSGTDPVALAATLNAILEEFVATAADLKKRNLVEITRTLDEQLSYAEAELRAAEIALEGFRVSTITLPAEGGPVAGGLEVTRDPVFSSYFEQKISLDDARHDRAALERTLAAVRQGTLPVGALASVPSVQSMGGELHAAITEYLTREASLRALRQTYTEEHPAVRDAHRSAEAYRTSTIPLLAQRLVAQLQDRERDLESRIAGASRELRAIPTRTIEEMRLRRNVEVRENLFTTLKNRYEEARLAEASSIPDVSLLDPAVPPQSPSSNTAPRLILLAIVGSIGAGLALALVLDRLDRRFRYPEQASREMGLTVLGAVPSLKRTWQRGSEDDAAQVVEAFRGLRLAVMNALGGRTPFTLTVSSPGAGDGKSMLSANLALSLAQAGLRTLLVDGDIRRGDLHSTFAIERRPGLTDVLNGDATLATALHETSHRHLSLLPSGARLRSGPELLTSHALLELFALLRAQYDAIIVDSAPLGAGIDPFALGAATGTMLVVLRTGVTDRRLAQAKLELLDRLPIHVAGAVLNDIRADGEYRYYSYLQGYAPEDESAEDLRPVGAIAAGTPG